MQVDGAVRTKCRKIVRSAVVLIDDPMNAVADHDCGVTTWAVGNRGLYVNRNGETVT